MDLMDMLSGDTPYMLRQPEEDDGMHALVSGDGVLNSGLSNVPESEFHDTDMVFHFPTPMTMFQMDLSEVMLQLFYGEITLAAYESSAHKRTSIDSLLESGPGGHLSANLHYEKMNILFNQLRIVSKHPSLMVDHFIPKKLLLLEVVDRLINMSGKFQLFNRLIDSLIDNNRKYQLLVVAESVKELELIEGLIIGKTLLYQNLSRSKLYEEDEPTEEEQEKYKLKVYLITTQVLYNKYTSTTDSDVKPNAIFTFDSSLNVASPSIELLRMTTKVPVLIATPLFSIEHITVHYPEPEIKFLGMHNQDRASQLFKWQFKVLKIFAMRRSYYYENNLDDFFVENYGPKMTSLVQWLHSYETMPFPLRDTQRKFDTILNRPFSDDEFSHSLEENFIPESVSREASSIEYKVFRSRFAEILHDRVNIIYRELDGNISQKLTAYREKETKRQLSYDADEDRIADIYRKLRKSNDEVALVERKLVRVETDAIKFSTKKKEVESKLQLLHEIRERLSKTPEIKKENEEEDQEMAESAETNDSLIIEPDPIEVKEEAKAEEIKEEKSATSPKDLETNGTTKEAEEVSDVVVKTEPDAEAANKEKEEEEEEEDVKVDEEAHDEGNGQVVSEAKNSDDDIAEKESETTVEPNTEALAKELEPGTETKEKSPSPEKDISEVQKTENPDKGDSLESQDSPDVPSNSGTSAAEEVAQQETKVDESNAIESKVEATNEEKEEPNEFPVTEAIDNEKDRDMTEAVNASVLSSNSVTEVSKDEQKDTEMEDATAAVEQQAKDTEMAESSPVKEQESEKTDTTQIKQTANDTEMADVSSPNETENEGNKTIKAENEVSNVPAEETEVLEDKTETHNEQDTNVGGSEEDVSNGQNQEENTGVSVSAENEEIPSNDSATALITEELRSEETKKENEADAENDAENENTPEILKEKQNLNNDDISLTPSEETEVTDDEEIENQEKLIEELTKKCSEVKQQLSALEVDTEQLRGEYQVSSSEAVQLSRQLGLLSKTHTGIQDTIARPGLKILPTLRSRESIMTAEAQLDKLKRENLFMELFIADKLDALVKQRSAIVDSTSASSNSRLNRGASRSSTPF